ncbi:MAG: FkbM family methyltransferase [Alphaproteobacteria bacterium]|nr:FkbM family methyltransferase [Alphaproteobacteria bacterium]
MAGEINTNFSFYDIVPDLAPLTVVDVGALPLDGVPEIYAPLLERGKIRLIAFEANEAGCEKLAAILGPDHTVLPFIIGDGTERDFHQNTNVMTSSLYPTNLDFVSRFIGLPEFMQPDESYRVKTHKLDDAVNLDSIDLLKMDVQGGELLVLDGAPRLTASALTVHTEVEFVPLYSGQPLFADIDTRLRSLDFQFHTFNGIASRAYRPLKRAGSEYDGINQLLWSDAVYVPDLSTLESHSNERLLKLVAILHDLYVSIDLALHILTFVSERSDKSIFNAYCKKLGLA